MLTWDELDGSNHSPLAHYQIIRRNCDVIPFEPSTTPVALVMQALGMMLSANRKLVSASLGALPKRGRLARRTQAAKQSGFFSASKANLRNAP